MCQVEQFFVDGGITFLNQFYQRIRHLFHQVEPNSIVWTRRALGRPHLEQRATVAYTTMFKKTSSAIPSHSMSLLLSHNCILGTRRSANSYQFVGKCLALPCNSDGNDDLHTAFFDYFWGRIKTYTFTRPAHS